MLNRNPSNSSNVINSYRKRKFQKGPFLVYGAVALVIIGVIMLVVWLASPDKPLGAMFATDTPTPTLTFTPTNTSTATTTPTETATPTVTTTATPSEPFPYTIIEGDSLDSIAQRFNLGENGSQLIYYANQEVMDANGGVIFVGQTITIPPPGSTLPTTTPIPADLRAGTLIEYRVLPGDTLAGIAAKFNSVTEDIIEENEVENANALQVGQVLQIPVNLITPTATLPPSSTPVTPTAAAGQAVTQAATAATGATPDGSTAAQCDFDENSAYVTQLQTLINNVRTNNNQMALNTNAQLTTAAKNHAVDMLCNNYFSDIGLDRSTAEERVSRAGLGATTVAEFIYASPNATPQAAFDWWMEKPENNAAILSDDFSVIGVSYVTSEESLFGGYFVVLMANP